MIEYSNYELLVVASSFCSSTPQPKFALSTMMEKAMQMHQFPVVGVKGDWRGGAHPKETFGEKEKAGAKNR